MELRRQGVSLPESVRACAKTRDFQTLCRELVEGAGASGFVGGFKGFLGNDMVTTNPSRIKRGGSVRQTPYSSLVKVTHLQDLALLQFPPPSPSNSRQRQR